MFSMYLCLAQITEIFSLMEVNLTKDYNSTFKSIPEFVTEELYPENVNFLNKFISTLL